MVLLCLYKIPHVVQSASTDLLPPALRSPVIAQIMSRIQLQHRASRELDVESASVVLGQVVEIRLQILKRFLKGMQFSALLLDPSEKPVHVPDIHSECAAGKDVFFVLLMSFCALVTEAVVFFGFSLPSVIHPGKQVLGVLKERRLSVILNGWSGHAVFHFSVLLKRGLF